MKPTPSTWKRNALGNLIGIGCLVAFLVFVAGLLYPVFMGTEHHGLKTNCLNNLKQIGMAFYMYEQDWDGRFPPLYATTQSVPNGKAWTNRIMHYSKSKRIIYCPVTPDRLTYSYNRKVAGMREKSIDHAADTLLVFESVNSSPANNNLNGGETTIPSESRAPLPGRFILWPENTQSLSRHWPAWARPNHEDVTEALFADGHVRPIAWKEGSIPFNSKLSPIE